MTNQAAVVDTPGTNTLPKMSVNRFIVDLIMVLLPGLIVARARPHSPGENVKFPD